MAFETYGLSDEQYFELFEKKSEFAIQCLSKLALVAARHNVQLASLGEKFTWSLFSEVAYAADEDARVLQKENNPEEIKRRSYDILGVSRDDIMEEIKSVNAKTEALVDYVSELAATVRPGITA
jgi:hypothetical protein